MRKIQCAVSAMALLVVTIAPSAFAQDTCDGYFTRSASMGPLMTQAYTAMREKNATEFGSLLPALETEFNALSATEIKPEACNGTHINAYTVHQYAELSAIRSRGLATGFPDNLPIVKQPDLNQAGLAYTVGWIKYEQGNFDGAIAAYAKGLAMFPHEVALQQEYLAALMQKARYTDVIAFADKILADGTAMDDATRAKVYNARAIAQFNNNDLKGADEMLGVSLKYNNIKETQDLQKSVRDAMAKPN